MIHKNNNNNNKNNNNNNNQGVFLELLVAANNKMAMNGWKNIVSTLQRRLPWLIKEQLVKNVVATW